MTKILNIIDGTFVEFVSSVEYDDLHKDEYYCRVINLEDSFQFESGISIEGIIKNYLYCESGNPPTEYEIIYD